MTEEAADISKVAPRWGYLNKRDIVALASILVAGSIARLVNIRREFNCDEVFSVESVSGTWRHTIQSAMEDRTHPPLHLFLLHIWLQLFGSSEFAARSLSLVFSILFLFLVWKIARTQFSFAAALTATTICAFSPFFIHFGVEGRPYSLIAFLSVLSIDRMLAWIKNPEKPLAAFFFLATGTALILAQYPGAIWFCVEVALLVTLYRFRAETVLLAPMALIPAAEWYLISKMQYEIPIAFLIGWIEKPGFRTLITLPSTLLGVIKFHHFAILLGLILLAAFYGLVSRFTAQKLQTRLTIISLVVLSLSVPVSLFVLSRASKTSFWADRQMIGSGAAAAIVIGVGTSLLPGRLRNATIGAIAAWTIAACFINRPALMGPPWRDIASQIQRSYPGRPLASPDPWEQIPLAYYSNEPVELTRVVSEQDLKNGTIYVCRQTDCSSIAQDARLEKVATYGSPSPYLAVVMWVYVEK